MVGDFEVVDSRTLKQEGKEDCRVLSLDCSKEFLEYLATKTRNHRYRLFDHYVYINGGKRSDSVSDYTTLSLEHEAASKLVKSNIDTILRHAAQRHGLSKAFDEAIRYKNIIYKYKLTLNITYYGPTIEITYINMSPSSSNPIDDEASKQPKNSDRRERTMERQWTVTRITDWTRTTRRHGNVHKKSHQARTRHPSI